MDHKKVTSPDGQFIAYVDDSADPAIIYITDLNGVVIAQIANPDPHFPLSDPTWSPDSSHLAFADLTISGPTNGGKLYVVGRDGAGLRLLTEYLGADDTVAWSPDGWQIAFTNAYSCRGFCDCLDKKNSSLVYTANGVHCGEPEGELIAEQDPSVHCLGSPSHTQAACFYHVQVMNIDGSAPPLTVGYGCKPVWQQP